VPSYLQPMKTKRFRFSSPLTSTFLAPIRCPLGCTLWYTMLVGSRNRILNWRGKWISTGKILQGALTSINKIWCKRTTTRNRGSADLELKRWGCAVLGPRRIYNEDTFLLKSTKAASVQNLWETTAIISTWFKRGPSFRFCSRTLIEWWEIKYAVPVSGKGERKTVILMSTRNKTDY